MNFPGRTLYELNASGLSANRTYAPLDLTLRIRVANNEGQIDMQVIYHDGQGDIDDTELALNKIELQKVIDGCLQAWERVSENAANKNKLASIQNWNLSAEITVDLRQAIRRGQALYRAILGPRDNGEDKKEWIRLRDVFAVPRNRPLRIHVMSDVLYIPWNLLYISGAVANQVPAFVNGFLGFRHQIVQKINIKEELYLLNEFGSRSEISFSQQRDKSLNFDAASEISPGISQTVPTSIHKPLDDYLTGIGVKFFDRTYDEFTAALQEGKFGDDILYFCCHAYHSALADQPHLVISPGTKLYPGDIRDLMASNYFDYQPFVFINACFAGHLGESIFDAFGPAFLSRGASTTLAPAVSVPRTFAAVFAKSVLKEIFRGAIPAVHEHDYTATLSDAIGRAIRDRIQNHGELLTLLYGTLIRRAVHMPKALSVRETKYA